MLFYLQVFVQSLPKEMLLTVLTVDALPSANTNSCYTKPVLNKGRSVSDMHLYGWNEGNVNIF